MRKITLFLFICLPIYFLHGQDKDKIDSIKSKTKILNTRSLSNSYQFTFPQYIPPTPQSLIFEKFVDHPVTEYYGLADINIPLYEIELNGLTIPLTLSYHSGGVKYLQYDGDLGANWSISATGYKITRKVFGKSDFDYLESAKRFSEEEYMKVFRGGKSFYCDRFLGMIYFNEKMYGDLGNVIYSAQGKRLDGEYDHFTYMTPTTNGHFILNGQKVDILERNPDIINMTRTKGSIKDSSGFEYFFGEECIEKSAHTSIVKGLHGYDDQYIEYEIGWPLNRIVSPFNERVDFEYQEYKSDDRTYGMKNSLNITDAAFVSWYDGHNFPGSDYYTSELLEDKYNLLTNYTTSSYITKIKTNKEIITFKRTTTNNTPYFSTNSRCLLTEIEVTDIKGDIIKTIVFNYQLSPSDANITSNEQPWHILLKSVEILENKPNLGDKKKSEKIYNFDYYGPSLKYAYPDQWGYYCFTSSKRKISLHETFLSDKILYDGSTPAYIERYIKELGDVYFKRNSKEQREIFINRNPDTINNKCFSLKRITYPTGGYSEYEYESNTNSIGNKIGGIRIAKIISDSKDGTSPFINVFKYSDGTQLYEFDSDDFYDYSYTIDISKIMYTPALESSLYTNRSYSQSPMDESWSLYKVFYPIVSVYKYDLKGIYNGHIRSQYKFLPQYEQGDITSQNATLRSGQGEPYLIQEFPLNDVQYPRKKYVHRYLYSHSPKLGNRKIINNKGLLVSEEDYKYKDILFKQEEYANIKVVKRMYFPTHDTQSDLTEVTHSMLILTNVYSFIHSFFDYNLYYITPGKELLESKTAIQYDHQGISDPVITTETYEYDDIYRLKKTTQTTNNNLPYIKEYIYPLINTELHKKNMICTIIESITKNNGKEIGRIKNFYHTTKILPDSVQTSVLNKGMVTEIKFSKYNTKGIPIEYTTKDNLNTILLWSYSGQYPIAEIKNATYSDVNSALSTVGLTSIDALSADSSPDKVKLDKLRTLPILSNAMITTYKYQPLVGMLESTDPSGLTTYYQYDSFGRLMHTKDVNGKTIQTYDYHYHNQ